MNRLWSVVLIALVLSTLWPGAAFASDSAVLYQGQLQAGGSPADGWYDFEFRLFDEPEGGDPVAPVQRAAEVYVQSGSFTLYLDFGEALGSGGGYLEAAVRPAGTDESYTVLSPRQAVAPTPQSDVGLQATFNEVWRLGVTVEGSVGYDAVIGRVAAEAASFRSNRGVTDMYFIFPAPATQKTIQAARFYIVERSGSYSGTATMTLEILDFDGSVQHTASSASVNMGAAGVGTWTNVALSGTSANLVISAGEYLAFHFQLSGAAGDSLDVRPVFEVEIL